MPRTPEAFIDGRPLLAKGGIGWATTVGIQPYQRTFLMEAGEAEQLVSQSEIGNSTLTISIPGYATLTAQRLTVINSLPSDHPERRLVAVADPRWLLQYEIVKREYNVRRRTGERRRPQPDLPPVIQPIASDVSFAGYSLNPATGQRWSPREALDDLLGELARKINVGFEVASTPQNALPIETLVIADRGDSAILRILAYFGGVAEIFCRLNGDLVVFDRTDQSERQILEDASGAQTRTAADAPFRPATQGAPLWSIPDKRKLRPRKIRCFFNRLVELRFDYEEQPGARADGGERGALDLELENVLPVTDIELFIPLLQLSVPVPPTIAGLINSLTKGTRTVQQGTWITINEALEAWNLIGWPQPGVPPLTLDRLRSELLTGSLMQTYTPPRLDNGGVAQRRIQALQTHYRRTYRIRRKARDSMGSLFPFLARLVDPEADTKAPALAYQDFAVLLTARGPERAFDINPENAAFVQNRTAREDGGPVIEGNLNDMRPAQAVVSIVDQDEGIISLVFGENPDGKEREALFSALEPNTIASKDPAEGVILRDSGRLSREHQVSVLLSTVPVSPNDERQYQMVEFEPARIYSVLGRDLEPCEGPVKDVIIQPRNFRSVSRHEWDDARGALTRRALGNDGVDAEDAFGEPLNPAELDGIGLASSVREIAPLVDHVEGQLNTGWDPSIEPTGAAGPISHSLLPTGAAITTVDFLQDLPAPDFGALLPEWLRQVALGETIQ